MLSKYGKSMHQLKIKLEKKICTYIIKLGRLTQYFGAFLVKQSFHERLMDMRWL